MHSCISDFKEGNALKKTYIVLLAVILALITVVGLTSLFVKGESDALRESTAKKPEFTLSALSDGSYIRELEEYYTDTFPMRQSLLKLSKLMNGFYYYSGADEEEQMLVIGGSTGAEQGGESL